MDNKCGGTALQKKHLALHFQVRKVQCFLSSRCQLCKLIKFNRKCYKMDNIGSSKMKGEILIGAFRLSWLFIG